MTPVASADPPARKATASSSAAPAPAPGDAASRTGVGPRPLARLIPAVTAKAMARRSLALGALLTDWDSVVGPKLAARTLPLKLAFPRGRRENAMLHIRVAGALAVELQHAAPQVIERINGFFGYGAVARLKLVQGPVGAPPRPRPDPQVGAADERALGLATASIADPGLRDALIRLGRALYGRPTAEGGGPADPGCAGRARARS